MKINKIKKKTNLKKNKKQRKINIKKIMVERQNKWEDNPNFLLTWY